MSGPARAADSLSIGEVRIDAPTFHSIGIQWLIGGDDNRNAQVTARYRKAGGTAWRPGLPLLRVWPETITVAVPHQFAGSLFDLEPEQTYEIELHATDPDGGDAQQTITATTRPLPRLEPLAPNIVNVSTVAQLNAALSAAKPGDVIVLANGTYAASFLTLNASGTADNPVVVRGESQDGVVLDGENCDGCNILEVYGSFVHVEHLTFENAVRAVRFQGVGATNNVVRHVTIRDVVHGIGSREDQKDFTICDNRIEGRLVWPWTFESGASSHWDDRGVDITGDGHVVCHNLIRGFGDPIVNKKSQSRSWDVYGNDILDSYDGTELDDGEGNVRLFHNRYTNVMDPVSIQPVWGGPAYVLRNVVLNAPEEPIKLKSTEGVNEPSGALIFHNTFVSAKLALNLQTPITQHNFRIENNLFVGPNQLAGSRTVEWTAALDGGIFDYNGYYPDGGFWFGVVGGENQVYGSWSEVQSAGVVEQHGVLLTTPVFAAGFVGPEDEKTHQSPAAFALAPGSNALDTGRLLEGVNSGHGGSGPDLGAWESGCPEPVYGPRAPGQDGVTNRIDCKVGGGGTGGAAGSSGSGGVAGSGGGSGGVAGSGGLPGAGGAAGLGNSGSSGSAGSGTDGTDGGCGCRTAREPAGWPGWVLCLVAPVLFFRRRRGGHLLRRLAGRA